jgi:YbgC/YbaW family acyl-CoA thioester hydrolase
MVKIIRAEFQTNILSEHIDIYGHLNNSYYPNYFEQARKFLQQDAGIPDEVLSQRGIGLLVKERKERYIFPVVLGDVGIQSELRYLGKARFEMRHELSQERRLCATCRTEHCFVNLRTGKPIRPPASLMRRVFGD